MPNVIIAGAARTPIGSFLGALQDVSAPHLGAIAIAEALKRASLSVDQVDEVLMGCVLPAGIGQAPARQAAKYAGLPDKVPATTVNKVCGSGLKSVVLGAQAIMTGDAQVVVAGGMESMSRTPFLLNDARTGYRLGHGKLVDGLIHDGLWDPYNDFHMGTAAELCAREDDISREAQDEYAQLSYERARKAQAEGRFAAEIVPVDITPRKGPVRRVDTDEEPGRGDLAKMTKLRGAFDPEGTVTAANSSKINDGAAAVVLMNEDAARKAGITPLARIVSYGQAAQAPEWFTTAPTAAINKALGRAQLKVNDVDLWEINEAFAVVALANRDRLGIDVDRMNVHGGAIALGHPIGASGTRILVTLLYAMRAQKARRGCASLCIGGGEGIALVVESMEAL